MEVIVPDIQWLALIVSMTGIFLNANKKILCWPTWILSGILWVVYYLPEEDWAAVCLWVAFAGFNIYGWSK